MIHKIIAVSIAANEVFALKNDGTVWYWGPSAYMPSASYYATQMSSISNVIAISANGNYNNWLTFVLMLKNDGTVWGIGYNGYYQLGNGSNNNVFNNPLQASGLTNVIAIATGLGHCLALKSDGSVWGWGNNSYGQLPGAGNPQTVPVKLTGMPQNIVSIGCGGQNDPSQGHSYAIDSNGNVWTWGLNNLGQLGLGNNNNYTTPQQIPGFNVLTSGWNNRDSFINFTGQHRCYINGYTWSEMSVLEGLVVVANTDEYKSDLLMGSDAMRTIEALPLVSLSSKSKDKCVFGVIAFEINDPSQTITYLEKQAEIARGDIRAEINAVGEGCVWVCDIDGALESGDYMTTSSIPGYASRQNDSNGNPECYLMNYTLGKMTMDCDFNPSMFPHMVLQRNADGNALLTPDGLPNFETETQNVFITTYYVNNIESTQEEYNVAQNIDPTTVSLITTQVFDTIYYVNNEIVTKDVYDSAPNSVPDPNIVPVPDPNNVTVLLVYNSKYTTQVAATQPVLQAKYKMRWIKADGTIISNADYDAAKLRGDLVYRAAFVGCTYHCG